MWPIPECLGSNDPPASVLQPLIFRNDHLCPVPTHISKVDAGERRMLGKLNATQEYEVSVTRCACEYVPPFHDEILIVSINSGWIHLHLRVAHYLTLPIYLVSNKMENTERY